jgi:hypothetical protein
MHPGVVGGIIGCLIGLVGGIIGTYCSVKNTNGSRERAFMIKFVIVCWIAGFIFLGLLFALPNPYRWYLWIPYGILLPIGINCGNRRQKRIRQEEMRSQTDTIDN